MSGKTNLSVEEKLETVKSKIDKNAHITVKKELCQEFERQIGRVFLLHPISKTKTRLTCLSIKVWACKKGCRDRHWLLLFPLSMAGHSSLG